MNIDLTDEETGAGRAAIAAGRRLTEHTIIPALA
jgi:hypothetical protein